MNVHAAPGKPDTWLTVDIEGMTCDACVTKLEATIGAIDGVDDVTVDLTGAVARVVTGGGADASGVDAEVRRAVEQAGYRIGRPRLISRDWRTWLGAGVGVVIGVALWRLVSGFTGVNLADTGQVTFAFVAGLLAGATTCAALVGALALSVASSDRHHTVAARAATQGKFHAGRVASFLVAGGLLGATGAMLPPGWIQVFTYVAVALVVLVAVRSSGLLPVLSRVKVTYTPRVVTAERRWGPGLVGAASVLVPCGITQVVALMAAATGSWSQGAVMFAAFAVGTIPGLLLFTALPTFLGQRKAVIAGTAMVAVVLAVASIGLAGFARPAQAQSAPADRAVMDLAPAHLTADGTIEVDIHVGTEGYTPSKVTVAAGYPVIVNFDAETLLTCAAAPILPDGNAIALGHGVTRVDLGVLEPKVHKISCSMNMYHLEIDAR